MLSLEKFRKILTMMLKVNVCSSELKHHYQDLPLADWVDLSLEKIKEKTFEDKTSLYSAYQALFDINGISEYKEG